MQRMAVEFDRGRIRLSWAAVERLHFWVWIRFASVVRLVLGLVRRPRRW